MAFFLVASIVAASQYGEGGYAPPAPVDHHQYVQAPSASYPAHNIQHHYAQPPSHSHGDSIQKQWESFLPLLPLLRGISEVKILILKCIA